MRIAISACMALIMLPAVASERMECFLTGSGYKNESYPSGRKAIWFIDGTTLRQHRVGEMKGLAVPMATMTIVRRDEKVLIAEWSHTLMEGATYRLVMDMPTGDTTEYSSLRGRHRGDDGHCKLLRD